MPVSRNYPPKADLYTRRTLDGIYDALDRLEARPVSKGISSSERSAIVQEAARNASGLLGPFGQPVLGQATNDPFVTQLGSGTITSVTVTAGTNLTGGGTLTSAGSITLNVSTTPSFTTVNAVTSYSVGGTKVLGAQGAAVPDAAGGATIDAEARTAINDLLARLRTHGIIAT